MDGEDVQEVLSLEAKMKLDTSEVKMCRTLEKGYKVVGSSGSGTIKVNKVSSRFLKKIGENLKNGKTTRATIVSTLQDPESDGIEKVQLNDCIFTELAVADWEAGKLLEESIPFNFSSFDIIDTID